MTDKKLIQIQLMQLDAGNIDFHILLWWLEK